KKRTMYADQKDAAPDGQFSRRSLSPRASIPSRSLANRRLGFDASQASRNIRMIGPAPNA
ncbi:MAG TPA: hypothetical protein PKA58_35515, partial [Polyangium sp.]|nr:hypothetical protein [Polyangium sp.]